MGSTVTTRKLAAAFKSAEGAVTFALFEESYSKNCYPRTPSWCCWSIGDIRHVMKAIFSAASSCEGGMLQGAGGRYLKPEGYIASWLKELAEPVELQELQLVLKLGSGYAATVPTEQFEATKDKIVALGRGDIAEALERGEDVSLVLQDEAALITGLYDGSTLMPWRILTHAHVPLHGVRNADLGYRPAKTRVFDLEVPRFYRVHERDDSCLILGADGAWRCFGWQFSYVGRYVSALWEKELLEPGSYRARIGAYREAIKGAPFLPSQGVKVLIDPAIQMESYVQDNVKDVLEALPHESIGGLTHVDMPAEERSIYLLTRLPETAATWVVPEGNRRSAPTVQLDLLAG